MSLEELEAYKMVFDTCPPGIVSENVSDDTCSSSMTELAFVDKFCSHESTGNVDTVSEASKDLMNLKEEVIKCEKEEEEVKSMSGTEPNKEESDSNWEMPTKMESKAEKVVGVDGNGISDEERELSKLSHFLGKIISIDDDHNGGEKRNAESEIINNLGSFGSMRKEKEWRRTLACKLFEERHNVVAAAAGDVAGGGGGGERMDLLWEAYETHIDKTPLRSEEKKKSEKQKRKKMKSKNIEEMYREEDDGDGDEQLCCLQALKFSTGKMNLGMARPNLLRLSKAFKGFGRFHSLSKKT